MRAWSNTALLILGAIFATEILSRSFTVNDPSLSLIIDLSLVFTALAFALFHSSVRYGLKETFIFFLISQAFVLTASNLSVASGFPFGPIEYVPDGFLPPIFHASLLASIAFFAYGYLAWCVANTLLGEVDSRIRSGVNAVTLPLIAAIIMTLWDFIQNPLTSTVYQRLIWKNGGVYSGVPLSEFLGFFLVLYLSYQVFALYLRARQNKIQPLETPSLSVALLPIFLYFLSAVSYIFMFFLAQSELIYDASGKVWGAKSIYATAALASTNIILISFLALVRFFHTRAHPKNAQTQRMSVAQPIQKTKKSVPSKPTETVSQNSNLRF